MVTMAVLLLIVISSRYPVDGLTNLIWKEEGVISGYAMLLILNTSRIPKFIPKLSLWHNELTRTHPNMPESITKY